MSSFEDSFNRLQRAQPTKRLSQEEAIRKRYEEIQAEHQEYFNHPVNVRFRIILGKMADTLSRQSIPLDQHTLRIGSSRDQNSHYNKKYTSWRDYTGSFTDAQGWDLRLSGEYSIHSQRDRDATRLFLREDGSAASMDNPPTIVAPATSTMINEDEITPYGTVIKHNDNLYVAYGDVIKDTLPTRETRRHKEDTYYDLRDGEIVRISSGSWEQVYADSYEDNLARLLASKLSG